jgi:hypothetical protein
MARLFLRKRLAFWYKDVVQGVSQVGEWELLFLDACLACVSRCLCLFLYQEGGMLFAETKATPTGE